MPRYKRRAQGIPPGTLAVNNVRAKNKNQSKNWTRRAGESSGMTARCAGRSGTIRQNIIGHGMTVGASRLPIGRIFHGENGTLSLLDQPAGEHGRRIFLEPLIQQFTNLLAEIGGVGKTRKLIGLQGIARGREKKFPGGLGTELRHLILPKDGVGKYRGHIDTRVINGTSVGGVTGLWKSVEKKENAQGLCSGCAGDYEDPDRSVWEEEEVEEVEEAKDVKDARKE